MFLQDECLHLLIHWEVDRYQGKKHFWVPSLGQVGDDFLDCGFRWFFIQFHSESALKIVTVSTRLFCKLKSRVSSWILREHLWKICFKWLPCCCTGIMWWTESYSSSALCCLKQDHPSAFCRSLPQTLCKLGNSLVNQVENKPWANSPPIVLVIEHPWKNSIGNVLKRGWENNCDCMILITTYIVIIKYMFWEELHTVEQQLYF